MGLRHLLYNNRIQYWLGEFRCKQPIVAPRVKTKIGAQFSGYIIDHRVEPPLNSPL